MDVDPEPQGPVESAFRRATSQRCGIEQTWGLVCCGTGQWVPADLRLKEIECFGAGIQQGPSELGPGAVADRLLDGGSVAGRESRSELDEDHEVRDEHSKNLKPEKLG